METYHLPSFPSEYGTVHIAYFSGVRNASEIRKRLIKVSQMEGEEGDTERAKVDFGFVEGKMVSLFYHAMLFHILHILALMLLELRGKTLS